jgi:glycosyltransferase involved in cell wall biosynthesis
MNDMTDTQYSQDFSTVRRKYKILLIVRWPGGGIRTFIRYVYRHFEPELYELTILAPDYSETDVLLEDLKGLNIEVVRVPKRPSFYEFFKTTIKLVVNNDFDLVHSQGLTAATCAAMPVFLFGRPHIVTPHDMLNKSQFKGAVGWFKKIGMGIALSMVHAIHCVSHDSRDNLSNFFPFLGKKPGKFVVIPNGIEVERFIDAEPRELRKELGVEKETFLIGFLGRFMSPKGFVYLVDAVECLSRRKNLPRKPLVLTFGEGGFIREEWAKICERGLEQYFRFLPFTPNVAGVLKALDVVVMPSVWETCPLLPMEVLVAGTPLIATSCIGLREVVQNTPTYVVSPRNVAALTEGIELFMKDNQKETFTKFAPEAARRFDVARQAKKIDELMRSIVTR